MRTLLIESSPGVAADAAADLTAAGVEVVRCHEPDSDTFACRALLEPGSCPLTGSTRPDVVLAVRDTDDPSPTSSEAGVTCGLRHGIPVVVEGPEAADAGPFDGWAVPRGHRDRRVACEDAIATAQARLSIPLADEVHRLLTAEGDPCPRSAVDVAVHRDGSDVRIEVAVPAEASVSDEVISVRTHARYRQLPTEGPASHIDVGVRRLPPTG